MRRWFLNFSFTGRARRSHTWANYAAWLAVTLGIVVIAVALSTNGQPGPALGIFGLVVIGVLLCATIDHMAITFRRAHDTGKSGWIWVMLLIPVVNLLPLYWLLIEDSQEGPNKYGPAVKVFYTPPSVERASL